MRTDRVKLFYAVFILALTIIFSLPNGIFPPPSLALSEGELIEGAKNEGKLVFYTTLATETNVAVQRAFVKKYPFIKMEILRAPDPKLLARIMNEARAGRHLWDALTMSGFPKHLLKKKNMLVKYIPLGTSAVPEKFKDPDGYWNTVYVNLVVPSYNTRMVSPNEIPQSYDDLLKPKWKGKLAFDAKDMEWFANMLKIMGEEKGMEFMKKLVRQDLRMVSGHSLGAQLLAAGEFYIHVGVFPFRVELMKEDNAPIDWVPLDPVIAYAKPASLSAKAPHPNAAKLFANFLFSKEGQGVIAKFGRITSRSDVPARFPKMRITDKVHPSDISLAEDFDKYNKEFRKIFFKGKR